jgi:hypothetical protein
MDQVSHGQTRSVVGLPQHPDEHRPKRPILLAVDQELGERSGLGVPVERADPVDPVEVWEAKDVEELGAGCGTERVQTLPKPALSGPEMEEPPGSEDRHPGVPVPGLLRVGREREAGNA